MGIPVKEILQRVQSLYSKGVNSDDTRLSKRHIYSTVLGIRNELARNTINKRQPLSSAYDQYINCIEMELTNTNKVACLPSTGCKILKSKQRIPSLLVTNFGVKVGPLTSTDLSSSVQIDYVSRKSGRWKKGAKYTKNNLEYYIVDGYIFIDNIEAPRILALSGGVFEDPLEILNFNECCDEDSEKECLAYEDFEFPMVRNDLRVLVEMAASELIQLFNANREDATNDTRDNTTQETK